MQQSTTKRAVGIVRVSEVKGREGDSFVSPAEQTERIRTACEREKLNLLDIHEELDVSGGKPLEERPGLSLAVQAIEDGRADVIVAAYFDRLFRSLKTQAEVIDRVERAGGEVLAVDIGQVSNGSAGQWLSGTMMGAVAEYARRTAKERSREGQVSAIARGKITYPSVPLGYLLGDDGVLVPDPATEPIVREIFKMRADGSTVKEIRDHLSDRGITRTYRSVCILLASRVYRGELHFGDLANLEAHQPIIDSDTFARVQRMKISRGRKVKSERLLARLGILRCGSCGTRMVVGTGNNSQYPNYKCSGYTGSTDCKTRVTISAPMVEQLVEDAVKEALSDIEGRASAAENAQQATRDLEHAQSELEAAIRVLAPYADETASRDRLAELSSIRDEAQARVDQLGNVSSALTVNVADWDRFSLAGRRAAIRATVESVTISPGRGPDRTSIKLFSE
jgi:site-specific DNA recombinase